MSGHNKFSKIKHKKAASDAKKSKVFSMYSKMITIASKQAGGDVNSPSLRAIIDKAKKESMPKDNIDRAVKKGVEGGGGAVSEVTFEFYGPGGVGVLAIALTDNNNRTNQEVKALLNKNGGYALGAQGSVGWAFESSRAEDGSITMTPTQTTPLGEEDKSKLDRLIEVLEENEDVQAVFTNAE